MQHLQPMPPSREPLLTKAAVSLLVCAEPNAMVPTRLQAWTSACPRQLHMAASRLYGIRQLAQSMS